MKRLVFLACLAVSTVLGCDGEVEPISGSGAAGGVGGSSGTAGAAGGAAGQAGGGGAGASGQGGQAGTSGSSGQGGASGQGGQAGSAGSGGQAGSAGAAPCGKCQALEDCGKLGLCVAKTVVLPPAFAIDATEVTRSQYEAWLATTPSTAGQPTECTWNNAFAPDSTCMAKTSVCKGSGCGNHPQVCIDECDAVAYCTAMGKRLCGAIGGGVVILQDDPTKSEWFNACTAGGANDFVYGDGSQPGTCNDYLTFTTTTVPVGSLTGCQSPTAGYTGVYDLIGNVWEWENNCNAVSADPAEHICQPRGFSFGMGAAMPECSGSNYAKRAEAGDIVGFRCCSSP